MFVPVCRSPSEPAAPRGSRTRGNGFQRMGCEQGFSHQPRQLRPREGVRVLPIAIAALVPRIECDFEANLPPTLTSLSQIARSTAPALNLLTRCVIFIYTGLVICTWRASSRRTEEGLPLQQGSIKATRRRGQMPQDVIGASDHARPPRRSSSHRA